MAILILPTQSLVLNAYAVLIGSSPGNNALVQHQAFINTAGVGSAGYRAALESFVSDTSTATLATTMLANLGLSSLFTQAQAVAFLTANPGNRVGAMIDLASQLYSYGGTDAGLLTAKAAYVTSIEGSYIYSNDIANQNGRDFVSTTAGITRALTTGLDNLTGTAFADTFTARTLNNVNTLNDGDRIDGGAGIDTLYVDFAASNGGLAITPSLRNIETVVIRAQGIPVDATNGNNVSGTALVQIDAQRSLQVDAADKVVANLGVTRWESNNSRSDVVIEDVRIGNAQRTKDVTIAMVETDPGNVDFAVYFDQLSLRNSGGGTSTLTIRVMDTVAAANPATAATPLLNNPLDTFRIGVNGVLQSISLNSAAAPAAAANADTYAQLLAAFQAALLVTGSATAALGANFTIIDPNSGTSVTGQEIILTGAPGLVFSTPAGSGWVNTTGATVPNNSNIYTQFNTGSTAVSELVTSTVVLDDVGRGSTGGDLVIGGLSAGQTSDSRGVERFEIEVQDNSRLQTINSTNNSLREVTIKNGLTSNTVSNAYRDTVVNAGKLFVNGDATQSFVGDAQNGNNLLPGVENNSPVGVHHGANAAGFADVRLIDGSAMIGDLAFTASVSQDSIAKYVNRVDIQSNPTLDIATVPGSTNSNFNVLGANFQYAGGAGNDTIVTTIDGGVAASRSSIVSGQSDFTFLVEGGAGNDVLTVNLTGTAGSLIGGLENWAANQDLNNNITISGGAGNDTIRKPGAGDAIINGGDGNDTVYTDNSGRQTGLQNLAGAVGTTGISAITAAAVTNTAVTSSNAVWVLNTTDQVNALANGAARNLTDLRSDANNSYNFFKGTVTVSFKGIAAPAVTLTNATTYRTSDTEINQAIKTAINTSPVLNKLLIAQDGPGNTLVVTSLIDGAAAVTDLRVTFATPAAVTYTPAEITAMALAYNDATILTQNDAIAKQVLPSSKVAQNDYAPAFAQDSGNVNIIGAASTTTSDNFVTGGAGDDVIVLGTTVGVDVARSSNDVVVLAEGFGNDTIVNFAATGAGIDHFNIGAFLTAQVPGQPAVAPITFTNAPTAADNQVAVVVQTLNVNDTDALVLAVARAAVDTATTTAIQKQVLIVVNTTTNVGKVYSVVNGTAIADAVVTLQGTIALADTVWAGLGLANFQTPGAQAEGASSAAIAAVLRAVVNNQTLTGTTGIDTLNTGGFTGVTLTGLAGPDTFVITAGSTGSVITDLATGDSFTVTGTGVVTAPISAGGFVATAGTSTNAAAANATLTAAVGGSVINMSQAVVAAAAVNGFTLTGGAGNDTLTGSAGADTLTSGATGVDVLNGGAGDDTLSSGGGTVTFNGGTGANGITASGGVDTINTVAGGTDTVTAFATAGADVFTVAAGGIANITFGGVFTATAASSNSGSLVAAVSVTGAYNFAAMGGTVGVNVNSSTAVAHTIVGTAFNDTFNSAVGALDTVTGGAGADVINFSAAASVQTAVYGASGTVTSATGANVDSITNFTTTEDKIQLTAGATTVGSLPGLTLVAGNTFAALAANVVDATSVATIGDVYTQLAIDLPLAALAASAAGAGTLIARTVSFANGAAAGTYLVLNDSVGGFQAANDVVIKLVGAGVIGVVTGDLTVV